MLPDLSRIPHPDAVTSLRDYWKLNKLIIQNLIQFGQVEKGNLQATLMNPEASILRIYRVTMEKVKRVMNGKIEYKGHAHQGLRVEGFEILPGTDGEKITRLTPIFMPKDPSETDSKMLEYKAKQIIDMETLRLLREFENMVPVNDSHYLDLFKR